MELTSATSENSGVWESVAWELCSTYFTLATHLQERPPSSYCSSSEIEKDITSFMHKALRTIDELCKRNSARLPVYAYRRAVIYHRLGSLYHKLYRENSSKDSVNTSKTKNWKNLAELNYEKSSAGYLELISDAYVDLIHINLERTLLMLLYADNIASHSLKLKAYEKALRLLLECKPAFWEMEKSSHPTADHQASDSQDSTGRRATRRGTAAAGGWQCGEVADEEDVTTLSNSVLQRMQLLSRNFLKFYRSQRSGGTDAK
ncbi:unnamed protein product [Soboliphyme baturini]|uniref:EST1 domain-containing protein n=1 Tax=Soboliphyme baturini TaxID=241478 RepID=A0A183I900_9BILA|nr:unnamed protein product [Soboliphyme baturini]